MGALLMSKESVQEGRAGMERGEEAILLGVTD